MKIRILQVVPYFYPAWSYGGIPRLVYGLSRELTRKGHKVSVITTDVYDSEKRLSIPPHPVNLSGIEVLYLRNLSNSLAYRHQFFLPLYDMSRLERVFRCFDIVHIHGHRNLLENIAHHYSKRCGIPFVLTPNGTLPRIERKKGVKVLWDLLLGNRVIKDASHFIAVSNSEVAQFIRFGIPEEKITMIYNGIELEEFRELPAKNSFKRRWKIEGRKVVLYLGQLTPRKGVDFLIRAFKEVHIRDATLVIAGNDMGLGKKLRHLIKELSLEKRVIFTGLLTGIERLSALVDADILIYPSTHEVFGLVPFEGLLCGTPVVVGDDCGCGEIINRAGGGYLVRYGDEGSLIQKIENILKAPDSVKNMIERGKRFIEKNLSWGVIAEKTIGVYRQVLGA